MRFQSADGIFFCFAEYLIEAIWSRDLSVETVDFVLGIKTPENVRDLAL
jgi:hypothetical protein